MRLRPAGVPAPSHLEAPMDGKALSLLRPLRFAPPRLRMLGSVVALASVAACDSPSSPDDQNSSLEVKITSDAGPASLLDVTGILEARVIDDRLILDVSFGGGCAEHDFVALAPPDFSDGVPVELPVFLRHDAHGDPCEALLQRQLEFDLSSVRQLWLATFGVPGELGLRIVAATGHEVLVAYDLR